MGLSVLVLAEVVDDLVAERQEAEQLAGAGGLAGIEVLDRAAQLEQCVADLGPLRDPPSLSALTGVFSSRLEVSAARRMSWSPMVRTFAAWAENSGDRVWALVSASRNPSTRASSAGTWDGSTCGAIAGACVAATGLAGSGAVKVKVATWVGGVRGDGAAAPGV